MIKDKEIQNLLDDAKVKHPRIEEEAFVVWADKMPDQAKAFLLERIYGKHLNKLTAEESICVLGKIFNVRTPLWSLEDLTDVLNSNGFTVEDDMSIRGKKYNAYDVNFLAQKEKLIHASLGNDAKRFIIMATEDLDFDDEYAYFYYCNLLDNYDIE